MTCTKNITPFAWKIYDLTKQIPKGKISTYKLIAQALGKPGAVRAVGTALSINPFAPFVPCHRVIATNGSIGGFMGSSLKSKNLMHIQTKLELLKSEGIKFDGFELDKSIGYKESIIHDFRK